MVKGLILLQKIIELWINELKILEYLILFTYNDGFLKIPKIIYRYDS